MINKQAQYVGQISLFTFGERQDLAVPSKTLIGKTSATDTLLDGGSAEMCVYKCVSIHLFLRTFSICT